MKYLLIAEKPSLMKSIKECYNNHKSEVVSKVGYIDFIALAGHVCGNYEPNDYSEWKDMPWQEVEYPMIPHKWKIKPINDARKKEIIKLIKDKIDDYDGIIVGTDSDQEGYGIYYLLEQYLGLQDKKALRFMEHSLTDSEILKSLLTMTDFHTDPTHVNFTKSFLLRSRADWLYGMNMTRMMSIKMNSVQNIGRVKSPTIKLVYDNSMAIEKFEPRKYWTLEADYGDFTATYQKDGKPVQFDAIKDIPNPPLAGVVKSKETERSTTHAPKLFDLTSIQSEAGSQFGLKPTDTLAIIQSLYEKHKIVSYPRTQCQYVSEEKAKEFPQMLKLMSAFPELAPYIENVTSADIQRVYKDKKVVNDKEVQKESHDALLPTDKKPNINELTPNEYKVCLMIYKRLLAQFLPQLEEDKTKLVIAHGNYDFHATGKIVVNQGWKSLYNEVKDASIPNLEKGDSITAKNMKKAEKTTKPPARLTQASLIAAMKNIGSQIEDPELKKALNDSQGIGTPATRASIIKDIIDRGFVIEQKNALYISSQGKAYIENLNGIDIVSPVFAAGMDTKIKEIQRGEASYEDVYQYFVNDLRKVCKQVENQKVVASTIEHKCKKCGAQLQDQKFSYSCPDCDFKIPKTLCGVNIDEKMLKTMYEGKPTASKNFKTKEGKKFSAKLILTDEGVKFSFDSGIKCPCCGKDNVRLNKGGAFCDCGLKIWRSMSNHDFSDKELQNLCNKKKLTGVSFTSKAGKEFTANVIIDEENKTAKIDFGK